MKNYQEKEAENNLLIEHTHSEAAVLLKGMFHLVYDQEWVAEYVCDECPAMLNCSKETFLSVFFSACPLSSNQTGTQSMGSQLEALSAAFGTCSFIGLSWNDRESLPYLQGTLTVMKSPSNRLVAYGSLVDRTAFYTQQERLRFIEENYWASLGTPQESTLRQNERIFSIVAQHSNRTLCYYDLATHSFRPWSEESPERSIFPHLFHHIYTAERIDHDLFILPESKEKMKAMFADMHSGKPLGEANIHIKMPNGTRQWFHFKYSLLFERDKPITALVSFEDVTQQHEKDISYLRFVHSIGEHSDDHLGYIEVDLTTNLVEKHVGSPGWQKSLEEGSSYDDNRHKIFAGFMGFDAAPAAEYYSPSSLRQKFEEGLYDFEDVWQVYSENKNILWVQIHTELLCDSLNGHLKMFAHLTDVTSVKEAQLAITRRADYDAMTGLLRRDSGIEQINHYISSSENKGGILILLDLDDLKGINDTLGHAQGDLAITGIAKTLSKHFRSDDILVRMGGDEFIVFLPGAAQSTGSVALAMSSFITKLSSLSIGENGERPIQCSAGCAVQIPGEDDFDTLYRRADIALYHVKRNGKNNFAFFEPGMLLEDYQFKMNLTTSREKEHPKQKDIHHRLNTLSLHFQGIVFFDLGKNQYRILEAENGVDALPLSDNIDTFWKIALQKVHPEDRENISKALCKATLMEAFAKGVTRIRHRFRYLDEENDYLASDVEINVYTGQNDDIYAFALFSRAQPSSV